VLSYSYIVFVSLCLKFTPNVGYVSTVQVKQMQSQQSTSSIPSHRGVSTSSTSGAMTMTSSIQPPKASETKAAKSIAIIVLLFIVSWLPLYTINTVYCFCHECSVSPIVIKFCIVLSHMNSVWNPALYAWGMRDFRVELIALFSSKKNQRWSMSGSTTA